jgi:hypothetical protein
MFCILLSLFFALAIFDSWASKLKVQRWWMVKWWRCRASRPPWASAHLLIVNLLHIDIHIHMLPWSQMRNQDWPKMLNQHRTLQGNSKERRFKETRKFPPCKYMFQQCGGPTAWALHHVREFPHYPKKNVVSVPCVYMYTLPQLSLAIRVSTARHHRSGSNTSVCGQPLDTPALVNEPLRAAVVRWLSRIAANCDT